METDDARYPAALRAWVAEHGSEGQRLRLADGLLDPEEIYTLVRAELFSALSEVPRHVKMKDQGVRRYVRLAEGDLSPVTYETVAADSLNELEHRRMLEIRRLAPVSAAIEPFKHVATCAGRRVAVTTVRVTVQFAGRPLAREYQIGERQWTP